MDARITYFLGANTPSGLCSLYERFRDETALRRCFLLKGGPGCGKSTLMRRVASEMAQAGEAVEYICCSGDPDSLDGIYMPGLSAAVLDATAPHVMEPRLPGVVDSYVDLGRYRDRERLCARRADIEAAYGYRRHYRRAERCLTAAAQLAEDDRALVSAPAVEAKLARRSRGIIGREAGRAGGQAGRVRTCFLSAVTCRGVVCRFDTVETLCRRVYELADSWGLAHSMLQQLADGCRAAGQDVILCPHPLLPDRLAHVLVPGLSLAFVTGTPEHPWPGHPYRRIRLDAMVDEGVLRAQRSRLKFSRKVGSVLLAEGVEALARAKAEHDALEALYHPFVDYGAVEGETEQIITELLGI